MLALVLMVGIVIDDAIVVLENIFRFVEEKKMRPFEAAREATAEIGLAVMATTLSLVVIFVPVSFMSSISGRFLYQFGITAAVSVMVSLLVSFTLTPMMSARLLRAGDTGGDHDAAVLAARFLCLARLVVHGDAGLSMRFGFLVALVALAVIASSVPLYKASSRSTSPAMWTRQSLKSVGDRARRHQSRRHGRGHAGGECRAALDPWGDVGDGELRE